MKSLPKIISKTNLRFWWTYKDEEGNPLALVARFDTPTVNNESKKIYRQYKVCENGEWVEGAPTPSPIYGINTVSKCDSSAKVYIFEGEKCAQAAHSLGLPALTSMMGSNQAHLADWPILARYRYLKRFVLIPDNDDAGEKYIGTVFKEIGKICPAAEISVCQLPLDNKGDDFIDWLKKQTDCPEDWDGFDLIEGPCREKLLTAFDAYVSKNLVKAEEYFSKIIEGKVSFEATPEPIEDILSDVLPCPLSTFPEPIVKWIDGLAAQMQIPADYLAAPLIVYIGSMIGRKRSLKLRPGTDWTEHANLWGMIVGRSAVMKSPAMKSVRKPLILLTERATKEYEEAHKNYELEFEAWGIRKKAFEEVYKKGFKDSIEGKDKKAPPPAYQFQEQTPPEEPVRRRYKTEDSTVEKLGELLVENPQGLLLFRDELSGWLNSFEKPGRENDRQFYVESWSGKEDFDVDRIGRGSIHIPALCLSIFGSIQPGPLSQYVRNSVKGGIGDDGFIQRFQVMVWPNLPLEWELIENLAIGELEAPIEQIFQTLDLMPFSHSETASPLTFTAEAQNLFNEWQQRHEKRLRRGDLPPHMESHLAKYKKLLPALCLILEHLGEAIHGRYPNEVSQTTLETALKWLEYFESHAWRIYGSGGNAVPAAAKTLIERIRKGEIKEPFSSRDVYYKHHWSGLASPDEVEEVLNYLVEKSYLCAAYAKTNGRPTVRYWVHPKVFE